MPSLAWFSYVGKILKDLQFHCSQIVPDFGDIMGNRQVSLPNSSACHFLFVTQWYCSKGWQLSHSSFYLTVTVKVFINPEWSAIITEFWDIFWIFSGKIEIFQIFPTIPDSFCFSETLWTYWSHTHWLPEIFWTCENKALFISIPLTATTDKQNYCVYSLLCSKNIYHKFIQIHWILQY